MDRALKERIIGAVVLVAIAVLVVPVFLDGPPARGSIVSEVVPLPGQDASVEIKTQVLDRNRVYLLSGLDDELVEDMGMAPIQDLADLYRLSERHAG